MIAVNVGDGSLSVVGYASRAVALLLVGVLVGAFADASRRLTSELHRYLDMSLNLLSVAGLDGHFLTLNPAWETTLGYPQEELLS